MKKVVLWLMVVLCGAGVAVATGGSAMAISTQKLLEFGPNNISYYDPDESDCVSSSWSGGNVCGDTLEQKLWTMLKNYDFTDEQASGVLANIRFEGGGDINPVRHEYAFFWDSAHVGYSCWTPQVDSPGIGHCEYVAKEHHYVTGIQLDDNGHWDLFQNGDWSPGKHYGIGLIGFSAGWRVDLMNYIEAREPALVEYFMHPEEYNDLSGIQLAEQIGEDAVVKIVELEIGEMMEWAAGAVEAFKSSTTGEGESVAVTAAGLWSSTIEQCGGCEEGGYEWSQRTDEAPKVYAEYAGKDFCGTSTSTKTASTGKPIQAQTGDNGEVTLHAPENEWLDNAGLEGFHRDPVLNSQIAPYVVDDFAMKKGTDEYLPFAKDAGNGTGLPGFIVLHWTTGQDYSPYNGKAHQYFCGDRTDDDGDTFVCPPHFVINTVTKEIYQSFPLTAPSAAVSAGSEPWDQYGIQIEVVGHGGGMYCTAKDKCNDAVWSIYNWSDDQWDYLAKLLVAISNETGIPLTSDLIWDEDLNTHTRLSTEETKSYLGVLGHQHIEGAQNNKYDPGKMWDYIVPALERIGYSYSAQASIVDKCGRTAKKNGKCYELPDPGDGGCTDDGYTAMLQYAPTWGSYPFDDVDIAHNGCGPVALAMILTAMTGKLVLPDEVADKGMAAGAGTGGGGSDVSALATVVEDYGLHYERAGCDDVNTLRNKVDKWLDEGSMMIFSVGGEYETEHGYLSRNGHVIAIRGKTSSGRYQVFDSSGGAGDVSRSNWDYEPEDLLQAYLMHHRCNMMVISK